ncbi:MAG TPA: nitroreductase family protein [Bacteroidales bacterium]|nr:nitroreductase family protein [Bacteroidales bacterium]
MNFEDIILRNRSYRRFYEDFEITTEVLKKLIGYARLSASSGNIQGLKFYLSADRIKNEIIFRQLQWDLEDACWVLSTEWVSEKTFISPENFRYL